MRSTPINKTGIKIDSLEEDLYAQEAVSEVEKTGRTDKRCLRCGGNYIFHDAGSAFSITCDNCDYKQTVRGI